MTSLGLTPLEVAVLGALYEAHRSDGFPALEEITVRGRNNTGAGRYVDLDSGSNVSIGSGYLDLAGRYIEMEGLLHGLMAAAVISEGKLVQLELATYGDEAWDGVERRWSIVGGDPESSCRG